MANHCRVLTKKTLDAHEVNSIVQKLAKEKLFDVFKIEFDEEFGSWLVFHPKNPHYMALTFWLSDEEEYGIEINGEYVEYNEPLRLSELSVIEFRHGHGYSFLWWIEGVFRENLAKYYNAQTIDDGDGILIDACPEKYETYAEWSKGGGILSVELKPIPKDVITKLGVKAMTFEEFNKNKKDE